MTAELLSSIAGIVLSLLFSYVPPFKSWFDNLEGNYKRLIMLGALAVTAGGAYGLACLGLFGVGITCDMAGALGLVELFIVAAIANQSAYALSPQ